MKFENKAWSFFLPQTLIVLWAAANFLYANRFENYALSSALSFYALIFLIVAAVTAFFARVFHRHSSHVYIVSYISILMMFLTPAVRDILDPFIRYRYTLLFVLIVVGVASYIAIRALDKKNFASAFTFLFLVMAGIPGVQLLYFHAFPQSSTEIEIEAVPLKGQAAIRPNVYFILLDAYMRSDRLLQNLEYDNSSFMNFLKDKKFFSADRSYTSYPQTFYSVTTTFRMNYATKYETYIWDSRFKGSTFNNFRELGYDIYFIPQIRGEVPCPEEIICLNREAKSRWWAIGPLGRVLIQTVPLLQNFLLAMKPSLINLEINEITDLHQNLSVLPASKPFFLYTHIMMPHPPYIRDAECRRKEFNTDLSFYRWEVRQEYVQYLRCGNRQLTEMLGDLIDRDPNAIIILQADHGTFFTNHRYSGKKGAPEPGNEPWKISAMEETYAILNAVRVPKSCKDRLYSTMAPVNTFRMVFSCITNTEPDYLPDVSFSIDRKGKKLEIIRQDGKWGF